MRLSQDTFIGTPILAERFSMSASSQYHNLLPSLHNLVTYISEKFCSMDACRDKASTLLFADYVDFDFDTISHALIINAFWAEGPAEGGMWNEEVSRGKADTMEVGVLNNEVPIEPEELSLSGFLTVVGDDTKATPDWVVPQWGSVALFELAHPVPHPDSEEAGKSSPSTDDDGEDADFEVTIPLHLRYLPPAQNASGLVDASLPWPVVFWACKAEEGTKMSVNPFDRTNLGYDGLFGNRVMFYHVPPAADVADVDGGLVETLKVPVLDLDRAWYVEYGTIAAVVLAMAWLLFKIGGVVRESGFGRGVKAEAEKKKQ
ncbi:protease B nonderepressible form [Neofusicoccum ribis]|uniref:Protein PBN1 n=1 Tax=Neofusicoccum ribis TaxID=45134 RepID=A0ABR3SSJ0_9PEZI